METLPILLKVSKIQTLHLKDIKSLISSLLRCCFCCVGYGQLINEYVYWTGSVLRLDGATTPFGNSSSSIHYYTKRKITLSWHWSCCGKTNRTFREKSKSLSPLTTVVKKDHTFSHSTYLCIHPSLYIYISLRAHTYTTKFAACTYISIMYGPWQQDMKITLIYSMHKHAWHSNSSNSLAFLMLYIIPRRSSCHFTYETLFFFLLHETMMIITKNKALYPACSFDGTKKGSHAEWRWP